jgi:hypothetical protein
MEIPQLYRPNLLFTDFLTTDCVTTELTSKPVSDSVENTVHCCTPYFPWERVCWRRRYPVTANYTCLLRICCLAVNVVSLFASWWLPNNDSIRFSTYYRFRRHNSCLNCIYLYCFSLQHVSAIYGHHEVNNFTLTLYLFCSYLYIG